jgi:5'-3' exonuclease
MKNVNENFHVYMFLNSVKSYVEMYNPDEIFCVWDEKPDYRPNKRKALLEEYKQNRDSERNRQVHDKNELIKEFLQSMGIPSIFPREYEADDAIGFINDTLRQLDDFKHTIVTVDRDLCQLIDENVCVYDPIRKIEINIGNFEEKLKYKKEDFIKVKALAGDKSDNIPGIKGFGNARIKKYLEGDITLTLEQQEIFERNLELVKLSDDSEEEGYVVSQIQFSSFEPDYEKFLGLCSENYFKNILKSEAKWQTAFFQKNRLMDILS